MFRNLSIRPCGISFSPQISLVSSFKKDQSKIRITNWYWYAINGWKRIRGGTCLSINRYTKAYNKYMKVYNKNKESPYLNIGM